MKYFIILTMLLMTACSSTATNVSDPTQGKGGFIDADGGSE